MTDYIKSELVGACTLALQVIYMLMPYSDEGATDYQIHIENNVHQACKTIEDVVRRAQAEGISDARKKS